MNKEIAEIFEETIKLLEIKGEKSLDFRVRAYRKAINILNELENKNEDIAKIYNEKGLAGVKGLGIGEKNAKKIEGYIKKGKIKEFEELKQDTAIRQIIAYFFESKGVGLQDLKENAKKRKIVYSRFTKPAKQLLELAGSLEKAKQAIDKVAQWANSRKLDYAIETVFKKWLELDNLKPKEIVKKPFYKDLPMVWSESRKKWFVIDKFGQWLEFVDKQNTIEWREIKN